MPVLRLGQKFARGRGLPRNIEVRGVLSRSKDSMLLEYTMAVGNTSECWNCRRPLNDPVSMVLGYGPDCCAALNIDRSLGAADAVAALRGAAETYGWRADWFPVLSIENRSELSSIPYLGPEEPAPATAVTAEQAGWLDYRMDRGFSWAEVRSSMSADPRCTPEALRLAKEYWDSKSAEVVPAPRAATPTRVIREPVSPETPLMGINPRPVLKRRVKP